MGSKYNQIRCVLIFLLTFFSCFFFNRYDNLGSSTGSDTPLLEVSYKLGVGKLGSYKVLGDDILNRVGHPISPLCPTSLSQMRLQMRTGNTSTSSIRSCSLREISLTTLVQWSASYKILIMAHDRMPSSFGAVTRFGSARGCARKFCYMNIIEGPELQFSLAATDQNNVYGRIKNIRWGAKATFPSSVLLVNSSYEIFFSLNGLEVSTSAIAATKSSILFDTPVFPSTPGLADIFIDGKCIVFFFVAKYFSILLLLCLRLHVLTLVLKCIAVLIGPVPEFMGCVDVHDEFISQKGSSNVRVLAHERYSKNGAELLGSTPFEQCWGVCSDHEGAANGQDNSSQLVGIDYGFGSGNKKITYASITGSKFYTTWNVEGTTDDTNVDLLFDQNPDTYIKIIKYIGPPPADVPHIDLFFESTLFKYIKITNANDARYAVSFFILKY